VLLLRRPQGSVVLLGLQRAHRVHFLHHRRLPRRRVGQNHRQQQSREFDIRCRDSRNHLRGVFERRVSHHHGFDIAEKNDRTEWCRSSVWVHDCVFADDVFQSSAGAAERIPYGFVYAFLSLSLQRARWRFLRSDVSSRRSNSHARKRSSFSSSSSSSRSTQVGFCLQSIHPWIEEFIGPAAGKHWTSEDDTTHEVVVAFAYLSGALYLILTFVLFCGSGGLQKSMMDDGPRAIELESGSGGGGSGAQQQQR